PDLVVELAVLDRDRELCPHALEQVPSHHQEGDGVRAAQGREPEKPGAAGQCDALAGGEPAERRRAVERGQVVAQSHHHRAFGDDAVSERGIELVGSEPHERVPRTCELITLTTVSPSRSSTAKSSSSMSCLSSSAAAL